jgi:hypothetical protein
MMNIHYMNTCQGRQSTVLLLLSLIIILFGFVHLTPLIRRSELLSVCITFIRSSIRVLCLHFVVLLLWIIAYHSTYLMKNIFRKRHDDDDWH